MASTKEIKTRAEYDERIKELAALIKERAVPFAEDSADKQLQRKKRAKDDPLYFCETYFPHYFSDPWAGFHQEEVTQIQAGLESDLGVIMAEAWSRSFGKTSLLGIALPIWAILIAKKGRFCIHVGADKELAMERTAAIKLELQLNQRIRHDWPELVMAEGSGEDHDFKSPDNARFRAQGYKQGIRGKVHGPHRPRLIIVDDLESHVDQNPEIAEKKLKYVLEEAYGAFGRQGGVLIWLGNLTSRESALSRFIEKCKNDPGSEFFRYRIVKAEENGVPSWPEAYPRRKLDAIASVMGKAGYERHYLMKPTVDGRVFKEDWLRFWNPFSATGRMVETQTGGLGGRMMPTSADLARAPKVVYCDPSLGGGESNDYKAIVTVAQWGGLYWLVDVWVRKATILAMLNYMYDLDRRFPGARQYMEKNFWQRVIWDWMPEVAQTRGYMLSITGVENRLKKEERVLKLQPLFEMGQLWICVVGQDWETGKEQLVAFPGAGYDDFPDALSGAVERFAEIANSNKYETIEAGGSGYMGMF